MENLVVHNTPVAHWHSLVSEAGHTAGINLEEELESYLVFLLMRFSTSDQLSKSIVALEYLNSLQVSTTRQSEQLQGVGDKCLLFAGLFPGLAERRSLRVSYFVNIGQGAYYSLSSLAKKHRAELFELLGDKFVSLIEVLHSARELNTSQACLSPIQAVELWQDTHSRRAVDKIDVLQKKIVLFGSSDPNQRH